jgi:stage II sporulation protein R
MILLTNQNHPAQPETSYDPDNLIRLHVVANSDSAADQALKRKVRDEIVRRVAPDFTEAGNVEAARVIARANLKNIGEIAAAEIKAEGKDYPVDVALDKFSFPTKHYGPFVLPAGDYEAVRVVIGAGGGANWWCVLFPPLCFVDMSRAVEPTRPESAEPAITLSMQKVDAAAEHPRDAASPQPPAALEEAGSVAAPEAAVTRVEFRFRLLDFFRSL